MNKDNKGIETEDLVERICTRMFLADFTVRSPKYRKPNNLQKEAADFLVPFREHLLAFQVRSKTETKSASQKDKTDYERILRKVAAAMGQFKAVQEALEENNILELRNARGIILPFDRQAIKVVYGVVILDLIGEEQFPAHDRTEILSGYEVKRGVPVHVFTRDVFEELSTEIDTVPDFIAYLDARRALFEKGILCHATSELDFLTAYKTRPDLIRRAVAGECDFFVIEEGMWEWYRQDSERLRERDCLNEPSRIVDDYLNRAHAAIGFHAKIEIADGRNNVHQGTAESYWATVAEFAALNRIQRRVVGEKLLEKMKKADGVGFGYGVAGLPNGIGIVVFASSEERQKRAVGLFNLCAAVYCGMGFRKVLGIATEPFSAKARSYDTICFEGVAFENHDELVERFRTTFKQPQPISTTEYRGHKSA